MKASNVTLLTCLLTISACVLTSCEPPTPASNADEKFSHDDDFGTEIMTEETPSDGKAQLKPSDLDLPLRASISDQQGRSIDVVIVWRTHENVTFYREDDPNSKTYVYPIDKLSEQDRKFVEGLKLPPGYATATPTAIREFEYRLEQLEKSLSHLEREAQNKDDKIDDLGNRIVAAQTKSQETALAKEREIAFNELKKVEARKASVEREIRDLKKAGPKS